MKYLIVAIAAVALISITAWAVYSPGQSELAALRSENVELQGSLVSLQGETAELGSKLGAYHNIAAHQEQQAQSLRLKLTNSIDNSLGDKLLVTQNTFEELPKTIADAEAQGYSLIDSVDSDGNLKQAMCFGHEGARHYAKQGSKTTDGVQWHGAPLLLIYDVNSEKLKGMVLESTTPQPSPPWEYHAEGHPGMGFAHASLHFWFTEPPANS